MFAPTVRATCGVPTTVAASWNSTVTARMSPAMKTPLAPMPVPDSETPVTAGPRLSAAFPSTRKSPSSVIAWVPRPSVASLPAASRIIPLFRVSASAATEIPFGSVSPAATV